MNDLENQGGEQQATQPPKQKGWFGRNWKWFVPLGCVTPIVVCGGGIAVLFFGVMGLLKESEVYTVSLAKAQASAEVREALGDDIQPSGITGGSINLQNDSGTGNVTYPITGSKGTGEVRCIGTKIEGEWIFTHMSVTVKGTNQVINLLE